MVRHNIVDRSLRRGLDLSALLGLCGLTIVHPGAVLAQPTVQIAVLDVKPDFRGDGAGPAGDLSGIACLEPQARIRTCVVINDENNSAQLVSLDATKLAPGELVELVGAGANPVAFGQPPSFACLKSGKFGDLDGEAVSRSGDIFYVVGSHGCSRKKGEFRLAAFQLARFRLLDGHAVQIELTYRLTEALARSAALKPFMGKPLSPDGGVNIEGLAVIGDMLFAGLRGPANDKALIVRTSASALFSNARRKAASQVIPVPMGLNTGIRDLAAMPDGRLLVLGGPSLEQDIPYQLYAFDPGHRAKPIKLAELPRVLTADGEPAKAEAVAVLAQQPGKVTVLVLFDGISNGSPRVYEIDVPQ